MSKYHRKIATNKDGMSDVYDVLAAFHVTNPAIQHAVKKLLAPGERGGKSYAQDLEEARQSVVRAQEMQPAAMRAEQLSEHEQRANSEARHAHREGLLEREPADLTDMRQLQLPTNGDGPWPLPGAQVTKPVEIGGGWMQSRPYTGLPEYGSGRRFVKHLPGTSAKAIVLETNEGSQAHLWVKHDPEPFLPVKEPLYKGTLGNCFAQADGWLQLIERQGAAKDARDPCTTVANVQAAMSEDQA